MDYCLTERFRSETPWWSIGADYGNTVLYKGYFTIQADIRLDVTVVLALDLAGVAALTYAFAELGVSNFLKVFYRTPSINTEL